MDELTKAIEELKSLNTNDPAMQRRVVKVFELLIKILKV